MHNLTWQYRLYLGIIVFTYALMLLSVGLEMILKQDVRGAPFAFIVVIVAAILRREAIQKKFQDLKWEVENASYESSVG